MWIPKEIDSIATRLQNGQRVKRITVRRLLELFDAERRGIQKVQEIRNALNSLNLDTEPDFEHAWIDSTIKIRLKGSSISDIKSELHDASDPNEKEIQSQFSVPQDGEDTEASEESLDGETNVV